MVLICVKQVRADFKRMRLRFYPEIEIIYLCPVLAKPMRLYCELMRIVHKFNKL